MYSKICIVGEGLTSLLLAKVLTSLNIKIDLYNNNFKKYQKIESRTVAISNNNFLFLLKNKVFNKKNNLSWKVNEIQLFNSKTEKNIPIINFKKKEGIFFMVKNDIMILNLKKNLRKNKYFKNFLYKENNKILKKKYDLIINCNNLNYIYKKFFSKNVNKKYKEISYTTIIKHKKLSNNVAKQYFTNLGPIAFLPISNEYTSVVWSINNSYNKLSELDFKKKVQSFFSKKIKILSFSKISKFNLGLSIARNYYKKNILNFGEGLHKIHPLAGQGLNMTIRDIKSLILIIKKKINLGLQIDESILEKFQSNTKHYNFLFVYAIELIRKYFSINNRMFNKYSNIFFSKLNKDNSFKKVLIKVADQGLNY